MNDLPLRDAFDILDTELPAIQQAIADDIERLMRNGVVVTSAFAGFLVEHRIKPASHPAAPDQRRRPVLA